MRIVVFEFGFYFIFFRFCRKGKVGSYREEMSEELIKRIDDWIAEKMKDVDFCFQG